MSCDEMSSDTKKRKEAGKKLGKADLQFYRACDLKVFVQVLGAIFVKEEIVVVIFSRFL